MALKIQDRVKQTVNSTSFILQADANQSYRVKAIRVNQPTTDYITVRVNRQTAAYLRVGGTQGNHAYFPTDSDHKPPLYEMLVTNGVFSPIPVPTGFELRIDGLDATSIVQVIYDEYDAPDVSSQERNGPDSNSYDFIQYGRFSGTLADGRNTYATQQTTSEYLQFPFGDVVPAKTQITIHGVAFSAIGKTTSSQANQQRTDYLRLTKERKVMFDEDLNGMLYRGFIDTSQDITTVAAGQQRAGNNSDADLSDYLAFDPPLLFESGEELNVEVETTLVTGSANILAADAEVAFILGVDRNQ